MARSLVFALRGFPIAQGASGGVGGGPGSGPGDGAEWNRLGPNAPEGLTFVYPDYLGDVLPVRYRYTGGALDSYGMSALIAQTYTLSIQDDPDGPEGKALQILFPSITGPNGGYWGSSDWGGAAPSRFLLCGGLSEGGRTPKTLYWHVWRKYSDNFTQANAVTAAQTVHDSGTTTTGTTADQVVDNTKSWAPNEHVGRFYRHGPGQRGIKIASNTENTLTFTDGHQIGGDYVGVSYQIVSTSSGGSPGSNAGTKGPAFPRIKAQLDWAGEDPKSGVHQIGENPYLGGMDNPGTPGVDATGEGQSYQVQMQNSTLWDGTSLSGGYPVWGTKTNFGPYPSPKTQEIGLQGQLLKEEYILQLNTPGVANGKFRAYLNGELMATADNVPWVDAYYRASDYSGMTPTIGGTPQGNAPLTCTNPRWDNLFCDLTYGGGLRVPTEDMHIRYLAWAVGVSDSYLLGAP